MASRKSPSAPEWQVILERIESQNRLTIEAVEVNRAVLEDRMGAFEGRMDGRIGGLETAVTGLAVRTGNLETAVAGLAVRTGNLETAVTGLVAVSIGSRTGSTASKPGSRLTRRSSIGASR